MSKKSRPAPDHVLYLGDWAFNVGPIFVDTPFGTRTKGPELRFHGSQLVEALKPQAEITAMADWELGLLEPGRLEQILARSAVVIISDVEAKRFHLYPSFFDRSLKERPSLTFPDRLDSLKTWVKGGGGLMMLGGWLSFSGAQGKGGWGRSRLAEALPVECLATEDLVESSAGFTAEVLVPDHPVIKGLPWSSFPPLLGYNEVVPKAKGQVLVRIRETGHPLVVVSPYGKGRILTYMSDPAPHWGLNFQLWSGYADFWRKAADWVKRSETRSPAV